MLGYRVPAPDEAMLISGGKRGKGGAPFRTVVGHGAFVMAPFRKARFLTLRMQEAEVSENCVTKQGISVRVDAVVAFKVPSDEESIVNAGQRFLSDENQMPTLTGRIFAGHLRAIVGSMTVEEIIADRQRLAEEVLDASKGEMAKLGLLVDSFQIQALDDLRSGYIDAMSAPHRAAIQQQAKVAQAQANQAAAAAEQESQRAQIEYAQQTAVATAEAGQATETAQAQARAKIEQAKAAADQQVRVAQVAANRAATIAGAQAKAETDKAQAEAAQTGPLAAAQAQLAVTEAQSEVAARQAELKERQLQVDVIKPAEADAEKVRIAAKAEAERLTTLAAAAASSDRIALEQKLIEQLPEVVKAAAGALSGASVTVLQGSEGISEMLAGVVAQGLTILDTLRGSLAKRDSNGQAPALAGADRS